MRQLKKFLPATKLNRFILFFCGSALFALGLSYYNHHRYWNGTIKSVQTTQLNIFSHTLPTKLSLLVKNQDKEEIDKVLNSAYGFIGLVITDCQSLEPKCDGDILHQTESDEGWGKTFDAKPLNEFPYDPLVDPAPLNTEGNYDQPYDHERNYTAQVNQGEIIGRVYYIRSMPPSFFEGIQSWLSQLVRLQLFGIIHPYTFNFAIFLIGGLTTWYFIEKELYRIESITEIQRKQTQSKINQLENRNQSLEQEIQRFREEVNNLQEDRTQQEEEIKKRQQLITQQERSIKESREQLKQKEEALKALEQNNTSSQESIKQLEEEINALSGDLSDKENSLEQSKNTLINLQTELSKVQKKEKQLQQRLEDKEAQEKARKQELEELRGNLKQSKQEIKELEQLTEDALSERDQLQSQLYEKEYLIDNYELDCIEKEEEINDLREQINQIYRYQRVQDDSSPKEESWSICYTDAFAKWWKKLNQEEHDKLIWLISLLENEGLNLGHPYTSDVKGTEYSHIRELRASASNPYRIFYAFDNNRVPILLVGGNKKGQDDQPWYNKYTKLADEEYEKHLHSLEENDADNIYNNFSRLIK